MKNKLTLTLLGMSLCSVVFLSCDKKAVSPAQAEVASVSSANTNTSSSNTNSTGPDRGGKPRLYYNGDGWCHDGMMKDCVKLPEIVVTASRVTALTDAANGSPADVAAVFNDPDFADFTAEFPDNYLAMLQSGNYSISITRQDDTKICFIAGPTAPVTGDNMEFAFQLYIHE
jgi:hypothetical protein